jgi:uncharacterized membrane protein
VEVAQAQAKVLHLNKMERHHKFLSFLSYIFGFIALVAVLVDNKKNKLYSFHIWQAFLLNVVLAIAGVIYFGLYIPKKILTVDVTLRTEFFLKSFFIPLTLAIIILFVLAIVAYNERYFKIPLIGDLSNKISKYERK